MIKKKKNISIQYKMTCMIIILSLLSSIFGFVLIYIGRINSTSYSFNNIAIAIIIFAALILSVIMSIMLMNRYTKSIRLISSNLKKVCYEGIYSSEDIFKFQNLNIKTGDEVEMLYDYICKMEIDIHKYIENYKDALYESEHDSMTNLYNRNKFVKMSKYYKRCKSIGVISLDVNKLKFINDNYGHYAGDKILSIAGRSILEVTNKSVHGYRMGGDEFLIIMTDIDEEYIKYIIAKWKEKLNELNRNASHFKCSISYGYSFGKDNFDLEEIIKISDLKMYDKKKNLKMYDKKKKEYSFYNVC